ncbi:MAG: hypothetical protein A3I63_04765 [Betaproteobacteria bacterium RIFCSPLOWO2_02_FULL_66_14]|nr:MAG: hypothetical protein A3I63_04765 [Betaproteobacteria bacterium RIFCSPLOWO2_02_FULL_66_14]
MKLILHGFPLVLCAALAVPAEAAQCTARSGPQTAALVELYTSEGCDSCPPADRWLSSLEARGYGGTQVVPIALHVDYWDYLGWKDPYAKAQFSARQRKLAQVQRARIVYTPQVMLQGKDFRAWHGPQFEQAVARINASPAAARLSLKLDPGGTGSFSLAVEAALASPAGAGDAGLYLAAYENKLVSQVAGGENRGKTLTHDYVVLEWIGPLKFGSDGRIAAERDVPLLPKAVRRHSGVVAFVQKLSSGEVLQALMLPAC